MAFKETAKKKDKNEKIPHKLNLIINPEKNINCPECLTQVQINLISNICITQTVQSIKAVAAETARGYAPVRRECGKEDSDHGGL
jgi:hypothetical protein